MKKLLIATVIGTCLTCAATFSVDAFAQASAPAAATPAKKPAAKAPVKKAPVKRKSERTSKTRGKAKAAAVVAQPIPAGAVLWSCSDNEQLHITGNMQRDQILTLSWKGKNYQLPREQTTTGADRFYDPASQMDLVVIPTKAMLFDDAGDRTRLADECMTSEMSQNNAPAPTQSNALRKATN